MTDSYIQKEYINLPNALSSLKLDLELDWRENLQRKPKLRTYLLFKNNFEAENYVKYCLNRQNRSIMAQFRLGILPLNLETGRFRNIPLNERFCDTCATNVEDETHFMLHCPLYEVERQKLFDIANLQNLQFLNLSNEQKLIYLVTQLWKESCHFLIAAWNVRQNVLYS